MPLDLINPPRLQLRATIDPQGIQDLANSMARLGLLQEILLHPNGDRYDIDAGHRRFLAAQSLGWRTIPARVSIEPAAASVAIALHENLFREALTPLEEAALCQHLIEQGHTDLPTAARQLHHTEDWVRGRLEIMTWPDDVLHALHTNTITIAAARHLATIDNPDYRATALDAATTHGMTERAALEWVRQHEIYKQATAAGNTAPMPSADEIAAAAQRTVCEVHNGMVYRNITRMVTICFDCWEALKTGLRTPPEP